MNNVNKNWDWKKNPLRHDPSRGYMLCEPCWNGQHFDPSFVDANGVRQPKTKNCKEGGCSCGCVHGKAGRGPKFTGEGQTSIPMDNPITVEPLS